MQEPDSKRWDSLFKQYELVACPASSGSTQHARDTVAWEEIQRDFKRPYSKAAQALSDYQDAHPGHQGAENRERRGVSQVFANFRTPR